MIPTVSILFAALSAIFDDGTEKSELPTYHVIFRWPDGAILARMIKPFTRIWDNSVWVGSEIRQVHMPEQMFVYIHSDAFKGWITKGIGLPTPATFFFLVPGEKRQSKRGRSYIGVFNSENIVETDTNRFSNEFNARFRWLSWTYLDVDILRQLLACDSWEQGREDESHDLNYILPSEADPYELTVSEMNDMKHSLFFLGEEGFMATIGLKKTGR